MPTPNPQQQIEKPVVATPPIAEPAFFVLPEEYRHGATGKKMVEPKKEMPKPALPTVAPPPPPKPAIGSQKKKGISRNIKMMLIAGAILLVGLAVGGYLVLRGAQPPSVAPEERPSARPAPEPTPRPAPEPVPTPEPEPEPETPFPTAKTSGADTDSDGLTDLEERIVYSTNPRLPDTDSDGFLDGNEVFHRYNPGGTAPGTLLESSLVRSYDGPTVANDEMPAVKYSLLYPSVWSIIQAADDTLDSPVTVVATTGETVTIELGKTGEPDITPEAWYAQQGYTGAVQAMRTKNGYAALVSEDQLTVYIFSTDLVAILRMNTGIKATIDYLQTFKMTVNSFTWL